MATPTDQHTEAHLNDRDDLRADDSAVDEQEDAPARWQQDTQPVEGEHATNLPPETEHQTLPRVQG